MARGYWDFRDELSTDDGLLMKGPRIVIPVSYCEHYHGHPSARWVQMNARHHFIGLDLMENS